MLTVTIYSFLRLYTAKLIFWILVSGIRALVFRIQKGWWKMNQGNAALRQRINILRWIVPLTLGLVGIVYELGPETWLYRGFGAPPEFDIDIIQLKFRVQTVRFTNTFANFPGTFPIIRGNCLNERVALYSGLTTGTRNEPPHFSGC